ncbi:hypothetical protein T484DRAFT_1849983 [Baffinella frigidus]|nr:hypothetical protein T484DRAFT_1849983 [Cryptophyta sp. CCMP2293]
MDRCIAALSVAALVVNGKYMGEAFSNLLGVYPVERVAALVVNGQYMGEAFSNLPDVVFPVVTFSAENISAVISTPPAPSLPTPREPALFFGYPGAPGIIEGSCTKPGHAELRCSGLCDPETFMKPKVYTEVFGTPEEQEEVRVHPTHTGGYEGIF